MSYKRLVEIEDVPVAKLGFVTGIVFFQESKLRFLVYSLCSKDV